MISNQLLRDVLVDRLKHIKHTNNALTPVNCKQLSALIDALRSQANPTATQLYTAASMDFSFQNYGLNPISPISLKNPTDTTCFQFGQGTIGWYFMYGHVGSLGFNLMLFRTEMGTPKLNHEKQIFNPADACVYGLTGGYGPKGGPWIVIPRITCRGTYMCDPSGSFNFTAIPANDCAELQLFQISGINGNVRAQLQYTDASANRFMNITLMPKKPPLYQGPGGCYPCIGGLGTLYWSYTNMTASITCDLGVAQNGVGWFDHQWMASNSSVPNTMGLRLLTNMANAFKPTGILRWLWMTIQLAATDTQYMIVSILQGLPQTGKTYDMHGNKFISDKRSEFTGKVTVNAMVTINGQTFPTKSTLTMDGKTFVLRAAFGNSTVIMPNGVVNWEGPADVFDLSGNSLGTGFLEANQLDTEDNMIAKAGSLAGLHPQDYPLFKHKINPWYTILLTLIIILGIVLIFISIIIIIVKNFANKCSS